jgi:hypothetical protein
LLSFFGKSKKSAAHAECRLCGARAKFVYALDVLARHKVNYFECESCGSLQTEYPYWLDDAYSIPGVHVDTGQAARVIQTWIRIVFLLETIDFDKNVDCIDYGGSSGLLTRLMRDSGFQYFAYDRYERAKYSNYFQIDRLDAKTPILISAFEVFEHFSNPKTALDELFATKAELIVFSTQFYEGQGPNWDYLFPACGQHVFFYKERALRAFAHDRGYNLIRTSDFFILLRDQSKYAHSIIKLESTSVPLQFFGELVARVGFGTDSTARDHAYAKERFVRELTYK